MDFLATQKFVDLIKSQLKISLEIDTQISETQPQVLVESSEIFKICTFLYQDSKCFFDYLNCITAIDNNIDAQTIDILYHISSIPFGHSIILKTQISRNLGDTCAIDSVSSIWRSADWHEREAFDFFGILFNNHPDLRRILLPADWEGHPMRKDYQEQQEYHSIKVKY